MKTKIDKNATKEAPSRKGFAPGTLTAPLPPALVTVGEGESANVLTVAWTGILASTPPKTYVSIRPERYSYGLIKETGEVVINLTTESLVRAADFCGVRSGKDMNKFEKCGITPIPSTAVSAPTLAESPLSIECKVFQVIESGTHDIFLADVVNVSCDEALIDERGRICLDRAHLIAYAHGEYFALGKRLGAFGFSAAKKKKGGSRGGRQK